MTISLAAEAAKSLTGPAAQAVRRRALASQPSAL